MCAAPRQCCRLCHTDSHLRSNKTLPPCGNTVQDVVSCTCLKQATDRSLVFSAISINQRQRGFCYRRHCDFYDFLTEHDFRTDARVCDIRMPRLPSMRAQKAGKIINISSVGGVWGQPFNDIYCASKFALEGMVESQAGVQQTIIRVRAPSK